MAALNKNLNLDCKIEESDLIGEGAYGKVYKVFLKDHGRFVAVKETNGAFPLNPLSEDFKTLNEEIEILKKLDHKNIVGYLGSLIHPKGPKYCVRIFMEFISGNTLYEIIETHGPLSEKVVQGFCIQIVEGLEHIHSQNISHRDIKSHNIMVSNEGIIKLIDFGCSKQFKKTVNTITKTSLTPQWTAPEKLSNKKESVNADIWSFGCTIFEMINKQPPWYEMDPLPAMLSIINDKEIPELGHNSSDTLNNFYNCCLIRDPLIRWGALQLLEHPFLRIQKPFKYKVFISYQWDSQKEVIEIKKFLDENNIKNWFDRTNLNCKEGDLHPQLSKGIEESEIFIPFITKKYDTSANCRLEFNWARELQKTMIVVMLEKIEIKNLKNIGIFIAPKLRINYFNDHNPKEILEEIHRDGKDQDEGQESFKYEEQNDKKVVAARSNEVETTTNRQSPAIPKQIHTLQGHTSCVSCLSLIKPNILASGSKDNTIKIWNLDDQSCIHTLQGHTDSVWCLSLIKQNILASGSDDNTIKIWNLDL